MNSIQTAKLLSFASMIMSVSLPVVRTLFGFDEFLVAVTANFIVFHAIWVGQWAMLKEIRGVDFSLIKLPLLMFLLFGNGSLFL